MMGAAYQAKHGLLHSTCSFDELTRCLPELTLACRPYDDAESVSEFVKIFDTSCYYDWWFALIDVFFLFSDLQTYDGTLSQNRSSDIEEEKRAETCVNFVHNDGML